MRYEGANASSRRSGRRHLVNPLRAVPRRRRFLRVRSVSSFSTTGLVYAWCGLPPASSTAGKTARIHVNNCSSIAQKSRSYVIPRVKLNANTDAAIRSKKYARSASGNNLAKLNIPLDSRAMFFRLTASRVILHSKRAESRLL